jgi:alpha-L-fucosidase
MFQQHNHGGNKMKRRQFLINMGLGSTALSLPAYAWSSQSGASITSSVPSYLKDYEDRYATDPRGAALEWFDNARFGLFMHYGLYSLLGRHEWVQYREKISVAEYAKLKDRFTAENFDADFITDLALEAHMKYINITTRHHDGFCLFDSKYTDFKSTNSPAKRDLVAELAEQCREKGLGFCLYYSHGRDWKHPHAPNNGDSKNARPKYDTPDPAYQYGDDQDLQIYLDFMKNQITELLTNYGPVGAIWLDGIGAINKNSEKIPGFQVQELYDHIHNMQPQVLVSYKQGFLGTEDFMAPERHWKGTATKPLELCDTLQPKGWGYMEADNGNHKTPDQVMEMLTTAAALPANLLLNTGPLPDGAIHPEDVATLREVGKRIARNGFPKGKLHAK